MAQLELKTYPDPCLRIKTKPVEHFDEDLKRTLNSMADIMYVNHGIGLAATQVGLGLCVFILDTGEGLTIYINPEILESSKKKSVMEEGCLSLPGIQVKVSRPVNVKIRAQNENGEYFIKNMSGLNAKAVQHENDHLCGRLLVDYLDPIRGYLAKRKLLRGKNGSGQKTCEVYSDVGKRDN